MNDLPGFKSDGLWIEDARPGLRIELPDIACSEDKILGHAKLFDAWHPLNTDRQYAAQTRFGRPIAHGPFCLAASLAALGDVAGPALVAMAAVREWLFVGAALMDESLKAEATVLRTSRQRTGGTADLEIRITDGQGRLVQRGEVRFVLRARPQPADAE